MKVVCFIVCLFALVVLMKSYESRYLLVAMDEYENDFEEKKVPDGIDQNNNGKNFLNLEKLICNMAVYHKF